MSAYRDTEPHRSKQILAPLTAAGTMCAMRQDLYLWWLLMRVRWRQTRTFAPVFLWRAVRSMPK